MAVALDAGLDLGGLAGCYVAIGLAAILLVLLEGLDSVLRISILGLHPFSGLANAIEGTLIRGLRAAISFLEARAAEFESGLIDALALLIAIPVLLAMGVFKAFQALRDAFVVPLVSQLAGAIGGLGDELRSRVRELEGAVAGAGARAAAAASAQIAEAGGAFNQYADVAAHAAGAAAERYAAAAVEALRGAESAAIANAVRLAGEAEAAGEAAAAHALTLARQGISAAERAAELDNVRAIGLAATGIAAAERLAEAAAARAIDFAAAGAAEAEAFATAEAARYAAAAEAAAAGALAQADAAGKAALAVVAGVAGAAQEGVLDLEHLIEQGGWAALIAAIPALALLVNSIATEAGLSNAECRQKVSRVCQTDASSWANLLGGLALLGFAFSLEELVGLARPLVDELAPIVRQAA